MKSASKFKGPQLLLFMISLTAFFYRADGTVNWVADQGNFEVGQVQIIEDQLSSNFSTLNGYTVVFDYAVNDPKLNAGLSQMQMFASSSMGYSLEISSFNTAGFNFNFKVLGSMVAYKLRMDYCVVNEQALDYYPFSAGNSISLSKLSCLDLPKDTVLSKAGTGFRSYNMTFFSTKTNFNLQSHEIQLTMFIHNFLISNPNGSYFYLDWRKYINSTHLTIELITKDLNTVDMFACTVLVLDKNYSRDSRYQISADVRQFECYKDLVGTDIRCIDQYVPELNVQSQNMQFYVMSAFNITKSDEHAYFNIDTLNMLNPGGVYEQTKAMQYVKISIINSVKRSCDNSSYYFNRQTPPSCIVSCGVGQYPYGYAPQKICVGCHYRCTTCDGYGVDQCTIICPNSRSNSTSSAQFECDCSLGYVDVGATLCQPCDKYIPGCAKCSSKTVCTQCKTSLQVSSSNLCQCSDSFLTLSRNGQCFSLTACVRSFLNGSVTICIECNSTSNFVLNSSYQCQCAIGSYLGVMADGNTPICTYRCGDGIYSDVQQCDDGNTIDGDGCNSACSIELDYICLFGVLGELSICLKNQSYTVAYSGAMRSHYYNQIELYFKVSPYSSQFQLITDQNLKDITILGFGQDQYDTSSMQSKFIQQESEINFVITVPYLNDISQADPKNLFLNLTSTKLFPQTASLSEFKISQSSNFPLSYNSSEEISLAEIFSLTIQGLILFTFIGSFVSLFRENSNFIGIEAMQYIQCFFFYFILLQDVGHGLIPFQEYLQFANGFHELSIGINSTYLFEYGSDFSQKLIRMGFKKQFMDNFNISAALFAIPCILLAFRVVEPLVSSLFFQETNRQLMRTEDMEPMLQNPNERQNSWFLKTQFLFGDLSLFIIIVFAFQILFSFMIQLQPTERLSSDNNEVISHIFILMSLSVTMLPLVMLAYAFKPANQAPEDERPPPSRFFNFTQFSITYPLTYLSFNYLKIIVLSLTFDSQFGIYVMLGLEIVYMIGYCIFRPYVKYTRKQQSDEERLGARDFVTTHSIIHNLHNIVNSSSLCIFLIIILAYNRSQQPQGILCFILRYWILTFMLVNIVLLFLRVVFGEELSEINCNCPCNCQCFETLSLNIEEQELESEKKDKSLPLNDKNKKQKKKKKKKQKKQKKQSKNGGKIKSKLQGDSYTKETELKDKKTKSKERKKEGKVENQIQNIKGKEVNTNHQ